MEQKLYQQMTPDEQLRYVTDLTKFCEEKLPVLERIGDAWEQSSRKDMETGLQLLYAFQFARDFVDKAVRYGDYAARAHRLRIYVDKIKGEVAKGLALKGSDGHTYALVAPTVPARRRGRPSAAEIEARKKGIEMPRPTDPEMEKQMVIARLMGVEVIVSDKAPREKNNAEVAAEKAARKAEYDRQNPGLFPADTQPAKGGADGTEASRSQTAATPVDGAGAAQPEEGGSLAQQPLPCPTMNEVYTDRINSDRLHLSDLAWLCSEELKARIEQVRAQRTVFGSAAERAKLLGEQGADAGVIAPYARQAEEAREAFESTYAAVDEELATVFYRLQNDEPYREKFLRRFKGVDIVKVSHIVRPYYEKMRSPELDLRIRTLIEQDSPEFAARIKAEEAKKKEIQALHRYIMRKDKEASDERVKTMTERIERMRELAGDEVADSYLPVLEKTKEDNQAWRAARGKADQAEAAPEAKAKPSKPKKASKPKPTKKN